MKKVQVVAIFVSFILIIILILGPLNILYKNIFPKTSTYENNRFHMNTGNTTRISVKNANNRGIEFSNIVYSSLNQNTRPNGVILIKTENYNDIIALTPLIHNFNCAIIAIKNMDEELLSYIKRLNPKGIPELLDTQVMVFGSELNVEENNLNTLDYKIDYIDYKNTNDLQSKVYSMPNILKESNYGFLVSDNDPYSSIAAASWLVSNDGVLLFADSSNKLYKSSEVLLSENRFKKIYAVGDSTKVEVLSGKDVPLVKINGNTPEKKAINFAKFYDNDTGIGWSATNAHNNSGHNFILNSTKEPFLAALSLQLAARGKSGPILWTAENKLSPPTESYLWSLKPDYWVTPAEGPYNEVWIIGDENIINYGIQGRVDFSQEIASYGMLSEGAPGGLDVLSIMWITISILGALWVKFHLSLRMNELTTLTKLMWILTILLLGPIGIWLYIVSYKDRPWMIMSNKMMWHRPHWNQTMVSTIMGLAFGAGTMIALAYIINLRGQFMHPLAGNSGVFLFGNGMIIQIILVYIAAFLLNALLFMPAMTMAMSNVGYGFAVKKSLFVVFISMTSVSIGMMISMWWLHMVYMPMMPEEDYVTWWGSMGLSTLIGGIIALTPNWLLVKYGKKMGIS